MDSKALKIYENLLIRKKLRGLEDLFFFNKYIVESDPIRQKLLVPHVHGEWADWFQNSNSRVKMILVPRSTFKSTFFTVGWSLQQIAKDRNTHGLIANATLANAQKFLGEIKDHLRFNETYRELYGDMYDPHLKWNEDEFVVKGRDRGIKEATITAAGVGGNLVSTHYSWILNDDLVNNENSATRYQADKVIDWWKKSFSLLDPNGVMLILGTRWAYYELYHHLLKEFKDEFDFFVRGAYKPDGSLYFPERFNEKKLEELKSLHGSSIFSSFYLNNPIDEETAMVKESQIKYYGKNFSQDLPKVLNTFSMCDPAVSQVEGSDFSTIVTVSVDSFNRWFVRETRFGHWTVNELIGELFSVNKRWQPATMTIEVLGQAQTLLSPIHDEETKKGIYLPLKTIKARPPGRKIARIKPVIQPRFEQGVVFIQPDMEELKDEILRFPKSERDDLVDCLADLAEIAFAPDEEQESEKIGSPLESRLKARFNKIDNVDPEMGEYW